MAATPTIVSEALALRRDTQQTAKKILGICALPTNSADEGVFYDGDADGTVRFRLYFPNAASVSVVTKNAALQLSKGEDGVWVGTSRYAVGLHCVQILIDNQDVTSPYLPIAYNFSRPINFIDVPPPDMRSCIYAMRRGVEYGTVAHDLLPTTDGEVVQLLIYLPPSYRKAGSAARRYPVLYLQHGLGENENGWVYHGKVNVIADNLIADGAMAEMIIVMGNGMMYSDGDVLDPFGYATRLVQDVVPYVDANYRTCADRDHRAMAGLSMGSTQSTCVTMRHPELFSAVGIFCGFLQANWLPEYQAEEAYLTAFKANPQAYRDAMKVVFRAMGDQDVFLPIFEEDSKLLDKLGFKEDVRKLYEGQPHCWQVWRMCAADFLPLIFK